MESYHINNIGRILIDESQLDSNYSNLGQFLTRITELFIRNASRYITEMEENPLFDGERVISSFWIPAFHQESLFLQEYQVNRDGTAGHIDVWCYRRPLNCLFEFKSAYYQMEAFNQRHEHAQTEWNNAITQLNMIPNDYARKISVDAEDSRYYKIAFITIPFQSSKNIQEDEPYSQLLQTGMNALTPTPSWGLLWKLENIPQLRGPMEILEVQDKYCPAVLFLAHISEIR